MADKALERSLNDRFFALNLFDRAAQDHKPGEIAKAFREILSIEVAVEKGNQVYIDDLADRDLQTMLSHREHPETSSISLGRAYDLIHKGGTAVIRWEDGESVIHRAEYIRPGEILIVPSSIAYLHPVKGLCFDDGSNIEGVILNSDWLNKKHSRAQPTKPERRQMLLDHTLHVMEGTYRRFCEKGVYRTTLIQLLRSLEPQTDAEQLANLVAELARVAAAFHDFGKADERWQAKAREIDSECPTGLIGRTLNTKARMGIPHTPPGYAAILKTCELLVGSSGRL